MSESNSKESLYFKLEILVAVPSADHENWDSGCDETFALASYAKEGTHLIAYNPVDKEFFHKHKHDLFDEGGGI